MQGSDLGGEVAAMFAASALFFNSSGLASQTYVAQLVLAAEQIYSFANTYRGKYSDCVTSVQAFYNRFALMIMCLIVAVRGCVWTEGRRAYPCLNNACIHDPWNWG